MTRELSCDAPPLSLAVGFSANSTAGTLVLFCRLISVYFTHMGVCGPLAALILSLWFGL